MRISPPRDAACVRKQSGHGGSISGVCCVRWSLERTTSTGQDARCMTFCARSQPQCHRLDKELTFRVQQTAFGEHGETLRTVSLNGEVKVACTPFRKGLRERRSIGSSCRTSNRWCQEQGGHACSPLVPLGCAPYIACK